MAAAILRAEQVGRKKNSNAVPRAFVVDWARTTVSVTGLFNLRYNVQRDPRTRSQLELAAYAVFRLGGDMTPLRASKIVDLGRTLRNVSNLYDFLKASQLGHLYDRVRTAWIHNPTFQGAIITVAAEVLPGGFAISEQRERLADGTLTFCANLTYVFRFHSGREGATRSANTVTIGLRNQTVTLTRMFGTGMEVNSQLRRAGERSVMNNAWSTEWTNQALDRLR